MAKPKTKDEVAEAFKNGRIGLDKALEFCFKLGDMLTADEINQWSEERSQRSESRQDSYQLPAVLTLAVIVAVLAGAITWVISHEVFGKGDTVSLTVAREAGVGLLIIYLVIALVIAAERRSA